MFFGEDHQREFDQSFPRCVLFTAYYMIFLLVISNWSLGKLNVESH